MKIKIIPTIPKKEIYKPLDLNQFKSNDWDVISLTSSDHLKDVKEVNKEEKNNIERNSRKLNNLSDTIDKKLKSLLSRNQKLSNLTIANIARLITSQQIDPLELLKIVENKFNLIQERSVRSKLNRTLNKEIEMHQNRKSGLENRNKFSFS